MSAYRSSTIMSPCLWPADPLPIQISWKYSLMVIPMNSVWHGRPQARLARLGAWGFLLCQPVCVPSRVLV